MKKLISFSVWGDSKLYCAGAVENVKLAKTIYPSWTVRMYVGADSPVLKVLQKMDCEVVVKPPTMGIIRTTDNSWHSLPAHKAMCWRYEAMDDPEAERFMFRDTDSRLNVREAGAIKEWEENGALGHACYECDHHWNAGMMGGMCAIVSGIHENVTQKIQDFLEIYPKYNEPYVFCDLYLLKDVIFKPIYYSILRHGHKTGRDFPPHSPYKGFVGECISEEWRHIKYDPNEEVI